MKKLFMFTAFMLATVTIFSQDADKKAVLKILDEQVLYWNKGDLENFMKGYWNNDSLMFVGKTITYGYRNTLQRYKDTYGSAARMGRLRFEIVKVTKLSGEYYFVLGKFFLTRTVGDLKGQYTLLIRKINGEWKIVLDHSNES